MTLLLPGRLLEALERAAVSRGATTGQFLRSLIGNCLAGLDDARSAEEIAFLDAGFFTDHAPADVGKNGARCALDV